MNIAHANVRLHAAKEMLRFAVQFYALSLCGFDLDETTIGRFSIVRFRRGRKKLEVVEMSREHFPDAPHQMTVGGEFPTRGQVF